MKRDDKRIITLLNLENERRKEFDETILTEYISMNSSITPVRFIIL